MPKNIAQHPAVFIFGNRPRKSMSVRWFAIHSTGSRDSIIASLNALMNCLLAVSRS